MITPEYCAVMARYNAWQNSQLTSALSDVADDVLVAERGAFFGSILATLNHLLWGDRTWMSRFDPRIDAPARDADHLAFTPGFAEWSAQRLELDRAIRRWADALRSADLQGDLTWYSGMLKAEQQRPRALCVAQLFSHQTHHRGQIHAMMTAAGLAAPVSDLIFMPEEK